MKRTDEQILAKEPLTIVLGNEKYSVPVLTILKQREWRKFLQETISPLLSVYDAEDTKEGRVKSLSATLQKFPEKIAELVFAYCPELPQQKILEEATEEQLAVAYAQIMAIAFPFMGQITEAVQMMKSY